MTGAPEAAIANGDYILFLDGGATGTHSKEAVHDLATLFAGTGLTATSSVLAVNASQTQITAVGTIATGVWQGTTVAAGYGGTGLTSISTLLNSNNNIFKTIAVSGQDNVVADSATDTLTLAAGANVTITTTAGSDTVTIASAGGSSLTYTAISDANVTMAVNTTYFGSTAGFGATRTYTTPGTCAVGDVIEIAVTTGDDTYDLIVAAAGGDSISGHSTGSLRLFITGEYIKLRCVVANTTWIVDHDGRIPCKAQMKNAAAQSVNTATTAKITTGTEVYDVGDIAASSTFTVRRDGHYRVGANLIWENVTYGIQISYLYKNGSNIVELTRRHADAWSHNAGTTLLSLSDGDYIDLYGYHSYGMARNVYYDAATPYLFSSFEIEEVI
jgi:hypothetical protein